MQETFTLDGVSYYIGSIPEEAGTLFNDIGTIDQEMARLNTQSGIAKIAKDSLLQKFIAFKDKFEVVGEEEPKAAPKKARKTRAPRKTTPKTA